jgi:hypothetical protein
MNSHLSSFVSSSHVNPSFGSGGMTPPYTPFSFGGGNIPQPTPMVGGWNHPSSRPNLSYTFPGSIAQIGRLSTSYISFVYPYSTMHVPKNAFLMENLPLTFGVSSRGSHFYSMRNPFHGVPSSTRNIYPHTSNPYHDSFSSQESSSVMIPLQPFMKHLGGGYYLTGHGHSIYQNPSWNHSFSRAWDHTLQPRLPFLATLNLPDLSKLMNDPMHHNSSCPPVPTKIPSNIPKFEGNTGEDPGDHVLPFTYGAHITPLMMILFI